MVQFLKVLFKSFENTVEKGEIACNDQFLLFPPFVICKLSDLKIVWEKVMFFIYVKRCK